MTPEGKSKAEPVRVVITGAAGQIAYQLSFLVARGLLLGPYQPISLRLLDLPSATRPLTGLAMELRDALSPCLHSVLHTSDPALAFADADIALLVGAAPRGPGMARRDLLARNAPIFAAHGAALAAYAKPDVHVLVVGNPANTNALVVAAALAAAGRTAARVTCLSRLDANRTSAALAAKYGANAKEVRGALVWGNHSGLQVPDVRFATVRGRPAAVGGDAEGWAKGELAKGVRGRGAEVIALRGKSSAGSAAAAICDHVRDWLLGTEDGEMIAMGIVTTGAEYGIEKGLVFSMPVVCRGGEYKVVKDLPMDGYMKEELRKNEKELKDEREEVAKALKWKSSNPF